jgi:geranylgeranyl pyrophosphate synthase
MDVYEEIVEFFNGLPGVDAWDEVRALFERLASLKPRYWTLPVPACQAVGGTPEQAIPAAAAIACFHTSIILVDDMLDADPRGEYHRIGMPAAANMACALQAAGMQAIAGCEAEPGTKLAALGSLNRMILATTLGQSWDVQAPADEAAYWRVVRTKSSPFFGAALEIGALLGGAAAEVAEGLKELGHLYGEMIQIHDDLNDALETPANPDWLAGRTSLPILFAQIVDHPDRQRFLELRGQASDPESLAEAQTILIRCGAISYGIDQLMRRYQEGRAILHGLALSQREGMEGLLDEVIDPVKKMFAALGMDQFSLPPSSPKLDAGTSGGSSPI